jgi:hypothetical protein
MRKLLKQLKAGLPARHRAKATVLMRIESCDRSFLAFFVPFAFLIRLRTKSGPSPTSNKSFLTSAKNLVFLKEQKSPWILIETPIFSQRFMKKINHVKPTVG